MILNFGRAATTAYVYVRADDSKFTNVSLTHWNAGQRKQVFDESYPFEFTVPRARDATDFRFQLEGVALDGTRLDSGVVTLFK
jgi:hypothetical protein